MDTIFFLVLIEKSKSSKNCKANVEISYNHHRDIEKDNENGPKTIVNRTNKTKNSLRLFHYIPPTQGNLPDSTK